MPTKHKFWRSKKPRKPIKRRTWINRISTKRRAGIAQYHRDRKFFLAAHAMCEAGEKLGKSPHRSNEVHHRRGRGKFLLDQSTWSAVCGECHDHIHRHPKQSYANGLMEPRDVTLCNSCHKPTPRGATSCGNCNAIDTDT